MKRTVFFGIIFGLSLSIVGCGTGSATTRTAEPSPTPPPVETAGSSNAKISALIDGMDACATLSSEDFAAVQGEPLKDTKGSQRRDGGLAVSQCFLLAPTYSKSVSLVISCASRGVNTPSGIKEKWNEMFHEQGSKAERDRDEEKETDAAGKPKKIGGVGDAAFWTGNARGGALYVLAKDTIIRLSLGGPDTEDVRIQKGKRLAKSVIKRLPA